MDDRKKAGLEVLIQLMSVAGGFVTHLLSHRWDITLVVVLALECFLHFIAFIWLYRHALDKLADWTHGDMNLATELQRIVSELRYLRSNTLPLRHVLPGPKDWPFDELFGQVVEDFKRNTHLISEGSYTLPMEDIQDVSLKVCKQMEHGAFCTALEENLNIFDTPRGAILLAEQYAAAARLATAEEASSGFTRLFVFDDLSKISRPHLQLMRDNDNNSIEYWSQGRVQ